MDNFLQAEENAVNHGENPGGGDDFDPREAEESFTSSVVGKTEDPVGSQKVKTGRKGFALKTFRFAGPILAVFLLVCVFIAILFVSQAAMPFAIVNRLREEFNTNGVSSVLRADNILDVQLATAPGSTFAITNVQKSAFKESGIYANEYNNGTSTTTTLSYRNSKNEWTTVVTTGLAGDTGAAEAARAVIGIDAVFADPAVITISEAMKDVNFKTAYTTASKTWRGGNSGWYDELEKLGEEVNGWTRSRWYAYSANAVSAGVNAGVNSFTKIASSSVAQTSFSTSSGGAITDSAGHVLSQADDGVYSYIDDAGERIIVDSSDVTTAASETTTSAISEANLIQQQAETFTQFAKIGASAACAAVQGFIAVQSLANAQQRLQKFNLASGYMEAVQQVQAGDDLNGEPMKEYNDRLLLKNEETKANAMMSDGMNTLFTGAKVNSSNSEVLAVNAETAIARESEKDDYVADFFAKTINDGRGLVGALKTCNYVQGTISVVSAGLAVASVVGLIGGIVTGQLEIAMPSAGVILGIVGSAVIIAAVSALAPTIARHLVETYGESLIKDFATEIAGEKLGNMMVSGGNALLSSNHQIGGGSPADEATVAYFKRAQEAVIAEQAEYERRTLSPFDVTSQHTFLGSMVYALVPVATSVNTSSALKSLGSILRTSAINLLPSASAIGETELIKGAAKNDCPTLKSVGIQGDPFCNPLYVTDRTTTTVAGYYNAFPNDLNSTVAATGLYSSANTSPEEVIRLEEELKTIEVTRDDSGKITSINITGDDKNELKRYILYCGQRTSNWGSADSRIAESLDSGNMSNRLSSIPVLNDFADFFSKFKNNQEMDWVTGSACVASSSNPYWNGTSGHNQLHQRFVEDQRLFSEIKVFNTNPVVAFLDAYYEENPLDNSYEGIIARFSGMTKEEVIATEQLVDALIYIANYDPSTRLAFGAEETEEPVVFDEQPEVVIAIEPKYMVYERVIQVTTTL